MKITFLICKTAWQWCRVQGIIGAIKDNVRFFLVNRTTVRDIVTLNLLTFILSSLIKSHTHTKHVTAMMHDLEINLKYASFTTKIEIVLLQLRQINKSAHLKVKCNVFTWQFIRLSNSSYIKLLKD